MDKKLIAVAAVSAFTLCAVLTYIATLVRRT